MNEREATAMDGGGAEHKRSVEDVFSDFKARRTGVIKALTVDVKDFYRECDPEKENLCLYGFPNEGWEVSLPVEIVPPELPEPALGINFARDFMQERDWLAMVAIHSDTWLLSTAYYFGARFAFDKSDRRRLFNMINDLPTVFEVVTGVAKKPAKEKSSSAHGSRSNSSFKAEAEPHGMYARQPLGREEVEASYEEDEYGDILCGACGENYAWDEFWICCDICEKWFHGKCVRITPSKAEHMKQYKCPSCSGKHHSLGTCFGLAPYFRFALFSFFYYAKSIDCFVCKIAFALLLIFIIFILYFFPF